MTLPTIEGPIKFNMFMAALLTWTALIIAGVIYAKMGEIPDWLIAIVFTSFGYWLPSPTWGDRSDFDPNKTIQSAQKASKNGAGKAPQ